MFKLSNSKHEFVNPGLSITTILHHKGEREMLTMVYVCPASQLWRSGLGGNIEAPISASSWESMYSSVVFR